MSQLIYFRYEMNCTLKAAITPSWLQKEPWWPVQV